MKGILTGLILCLGLLTCLSQAAEPTLGLELSRQVRLELVLVRAGTFTQGSPAEEPGRGNDETQRQVRISRDFYIARTPVTVSQWERFVAETGYRTEAETGTSGGYGWNGTALEQKKAFTWKNPGFDQGPHYPVCLVTYPDAQAFCAWLEKKTRRKVTLPTEAQWEYACRAGTDTPWHGAEGAANAWHKENAGDGTRPGDSNRPNPWNIFIGGNISEWCLDWYGPYPAGDAVDPRQDNQNLSDKPRRVLRGGSWNRGPNNTRSAARYRADPRSRNADIGFRIVCSVEAPPYPTMPPSRELPPVEADSPSQEEEAATPAQPRTETHTRQVEVRHTRSSPLGGLIKGLLCLVIPILVVVQIIRAISRRSSAAPARRTHDYISRTIARPATPVRKVDDGFWINGDWPEGTLLKVRYMVAGAAMVQEILYRPGEEGQFIYTGGAPDSVSVVAGADPHDTTESGVFSSPPPFPPRRHDDDDDERRRPPVRPSAY